MINIQINEEGPKIYETDCSPKLSKKEISYLNEHNKVTAIVLTKLTGTAVTVFIGQPDAKMVSFITNEDKLDEEPDWQEVYEETNKIHEKMDEWASKKGVDSGV